MSYSDFKGTNRFVQHMVAAASFGTATASATDGIAGDGVTLPKFTRRVQVNKAMVRVTTAPDTGSTAVKLHFLNGTDTFATITVTTATASQVLFADCTAAVSTFTASGQPTWKITGTATASADANGAYDLSFELTELYA